MRKQKVVIVSPEAPPEVGGAQSVIDWMSQGLTAKGYDVLVIGRSETAEPREYEYNGYKVVRVREMHQDWHNERMRATGGDARQVSRELVAALTPYLRGATFVNAHTCSYFPAVFNGVSRAGHEVGAETIFTYHLINGVGAAADPPYDLNVFVSTWQHAMHAKIAREAEREVGAGTIIPMGIDTTFFDRRLATPVSEIIELSRQAAGGRPPGLRHLVTGNLSKVKGCREAIERFIEYQRYCRDRADYVNLIWTESFN